MVFPTGYGREGLENCNPAQEKIVKRWAEKLKKNTPSMTEEEAYSVADAVHYAIQDVDGVITDDTPLSVTLDHFGFDSLDSIEVIMNIESRLNLNDELKSFNLPPADLADKLQEITIMDIMQAVYDEVYKPKTS